MHAIPARRCHLNRQRIIEALNADVSVELGGVMQYLYQYFTAEERHGGGVKEAFRQTGIEEMRHLSRLARRVAELGGEPTARVPDFARGGDLHQMMRDDLERERRVVEGYRDHIRLCAEEGDETTRRMLEGILADELRHVQLWEQKLATPVPAP